MYSRFIEAPGRKSFFLFGPRGTGKSSWVKARFPNAVYLDLLDSALFNDLLAQPQRLENMIPPDFSDWVVIDEIQRVPELLNEVHRLIESKRIRFVLTGSSARKLRRKGTNLLAGRALTHFMHPLTTAELGKDFHLEHSLVYGHLPCAYTEADPKRYLESYVSTYLREEVQQEGLTRNLASFSRFLEAASFSQASILNVSEVARECSIERKVVENYFSILEDLLLAWTIPVFTRKAKRRLVVHPKFYFFDVGVFRTIRPSGPLDRPEEIDGAALETLFLQEARAINDYQNLDYHFYYWRTSNNIEVDFVLYGKKGLKVFEIKRAGRIKGSDLTGLQSFVADYPMAQAFLIYGGQRKMREGPISIIPLNECLRELPALLK